MKQTVNDTSLFGIFANARMTNGKDWLKVENYSTPSFTVQDIGSNLCRYQFASLYTIYYSFSVNEASPAYYLRKITQTPLFTTIKIDAAASTTSTLSLQHAFKYVYVPPEGTSGASPIVSDQKKYGTGIAGTFTQFFSEVVLPLVQPSTVQNA